MDILQCEFNPLEKLLVSPVGLSTSFANVKVMNLTIKDILVAFTDFGKVQLLNDIEPLQRLQIPVDAGAVDTLDLLVQELLDFLDGDMAGFIIKDELKKQAAGRRDPHVV